MATTERPTHGRSLTAAASHTKQPVRRVLVVDDDDDVRMLCVLILRARGFEVDDASDGLRGLDAARAHRPDLLLSDLNMPALNGFELAQALQDDAETCDIPFVFVSGDDTHANRAHAETLGAFAFVAKPFEPRVLAAIVADAIGSTRRLAHTTA